MIANLEKYLEIVIYYHMNNHHYYCSIPYPFPSSSFFGREVFFRIYFNLFFNSSLEIWFTCYTIQPFEVPFITFTELCNHYYNFRIFSLCQKGTLDPLAFDLQPLHPSPSALAINNLRPVSMDLLIMNVSYKWNCAICGPVSLASSIYLLWFCDPPPSLPQVWSFQAHLQAPGSAAPTLKKPCCRPSQRCP